MVRTNLMDRKMHGMLIICTESLEDLYLCSPFSGLLQYPNMYYILATVLFAPKNLIQCLFEVMC